MKNPGQPKSPPSWWRDRSPSHIESEFSKELTDLADAIEKEVWFGDREKHSRYRVDFIFRDARLIVELDGHDSHSSKEQLEKDAIRQRYLTRAGYSVIRFTGREINRNAKACVNEVRTIYKERMQREPAKYRVMYVDFPFLRKEIRETLKFYREYHPDRDFSVPALENVLPHAIEWLYEKSFVTVFLFHRPEEFEEVKSLDGIVKDYPKGEMRINTIQDDLYSAELGNHLMDYSHLYDDFMLIGDDQIYIPPLSSVLPGEPITERIGNYEYQYFPNVKLLRRNNYDTAYGDTLLANVKWQKVEYIIAASIGLDFSEM